MEMTIIDKIIKGARLYGSITVIIGAIAGFAIKIDRKHRSDTEIQQDVKFIKDTFKIYFGLMDTRMQRIENSQLETNKQLVDVAMEQKVTQTYVIKHLQKEEMYEDVFNFQQELLDELKKNGSLEMVYLEMKESQ